MSQRCAFATEKRYLPVLLPFGLRPSKDGVTLTDGSFVATFGLLKLATPLANITRAHMARGPSALTVTIADLEGLTNTLGDHDEPPTRTAPPGR